MDIDQFESQKLFTIKQNQLKMVSRRGFDIERERNLLGIKLKDFLDAYVPFAKKSGKTIRQILSQLYRNDKGEKLYVYFSENSVDKKQLGVEYIGDAITKMDEYRAKNGIIITHKPLSSDASKKIQSLVTYNINIFLESEMTYDPISHFLTPEHKALSTEEQRDFMSRNNLSIDQFPVILTTDMIVRYYGFRPGQVIQINRTNMFDTLIQESVGYRAVKEDIGEI